MTLKITPATRSWVALLGVLLAQACFVTPPLSEEGDEARFLRLVPWTAASGTRTVAVPPGGTVTDVTSGPFLELDVGGRAMGEELNVQRGATIPVVAEAQLNPDIAEMDRVELVMHGDVVATERAESGGRVRLRTSTRIDASAWLALRAYGKSENSRAMIVAHSTSVYVIGDGQPTWKASAVPELVQRYRGALQEMLDTPLDPDEDLETFETRELLLEQWTRQRELIRGRVREADMRLEDLVEQVERR